MMMHLYKSLRGLTRMTFAGVGLMAFASSALHAAPPPVEPPNLSVLDMNISPEEHMASDADAPPTPESGTENPEDLLKSAPVTHAAKESKSAAKNDGLPGKLPDTNTPESTARAEGLPPLPSEGLEQVDIPAEPEAVAAAPAEEPTEGQSSKRFDRSIPLYDRENPTMGVDIHGSLQSFGTPIKSQPIGGGAINESNVRNFGVGFELEPKFLQSIGVFSLGPSANMYILEPAGDLTEGSFSIYSLGFSAKYQLKFMRSQIFVPFAGFEVQMIHYSFHPETNLGSGWTTGSGPTFGGMLLMNWMEPSSAHNLFSEYGIKRTYLVGEAKMIKTSETVLTTDGTALYFGLRMEY